MSDIGHNGVNAIELQGYVDRLKRLAEAMDSLKEDARELLQEAQSSGYEGAAIKSLVRAAMMDEKKKARERMKAEMLALYAGALQMDLFA